MDRLAAGEYAEELSGEAHEALERVQSQLSAEGVNAEIRVVERTSAARGLAAAIEEVRPGVVVVGSTRRGPVGQVLPGSTAARVIEGAPCPVAVAPHGYEPPQGGVQTIGAAFVPTPEGREAPRQARNSRALGARLRAIAVLDPGLVEAQSPAMMALHHHDRDPDEDAGAIRAIEAERTLDHAIAALPPGADVEPDVLFQQPAERDRRSVRESRSARDGLSRLRTRARGDARRVTSGHRPCRVPGADPSARDRGRP